MRVIIYGTHSEDWMTALQPGAPVWRLLPAVKEVLHENPGDTTLAQHEANSISTVVIPLMEDHIAGCPASFARLLPNRHALQVLRDKAEFASYARSNGLAHLCPESFPGPEAARFPCVLKRVDLNGGVGVRIVYSPEELGTRLADEPWRGHAVHLQTFVDGPCQSVAHCVCKDGRILWHCAYDYDPAEAQAVCCKGRRATRKNEPAARLAEFEAFLVPLSFSGPCCIDYKITEAGQTVILEINPRFGGSLMRPEHVDDLRSALSAILSLAIP